jgi:AcrR family transcriptional regulator
MRRGEGVGRDQWVDAGLAALGDKGLGAVAVETLARQLGVTKGSFYWHFPSRDELVAAVLARWEQRGTDDVIAGLLAIADPRRRLMALFRAVSRAPAAGRVLEALEASDHPAVAPVLARVTARRLEFIAACYRQLGWPRARAQHRALLAYAAYVGLLQLGRTAPRALPARSDEYVRHLVATLVPGRG